jgi:von Willebrand factor type A domain
MATFSNRSGRGLWVEGNLVVTALAFVQGCGASGAPVDDEVPVTASSAAVRSDAPSLVSGAEQPSAKSGTCAAVSVATELKQVSLVMLLDQSGSMGDTQAKFDAKWGPVTRALSAFYKNPASKGMSAALTFFPVANSSSLDRCEGATYDAADVKLTPLPSNTFATEIAKHQPRNSGTPIRAALAGAVAQAKALQALRRPNEKVAIVIATDGEPAQCSANDDKISNIAADVARAGVDVYVVGIGSNLASLDAIAAGGKTGKARIVNTQNPGQTSADLTAALTEIRYASSPCEVALPKPPDGRALEPNKIAVRVKGKIVPYRAQCSTEGGWTLETSKGAKVPDKIELCRSTCGDLRVEGAKLEISFECSQQHERARQTQLSLPGQISPPTQSFASQGFGLSHPSEDLVHT